MNKLKIPHVVLLGNHDRSGHGREETYRVIFGDPNFSFIAGRVKFVCPEYQRYQFLLRPIPDFEFLAAQIRDHEEEFDKTVVSMYIRPFCNEFNNNVATRIPALHQGISRTAVLYIRTRTPSLRERPL